MTSHLVEADADFELLPSDAAAWLLTWLEHHGALVGLTEEHYLRVNLDGLRHLDAAGAERLSRNVLQLRNELRQLLLDRGAVVH